MVTRIQNCDLSGRNTFRMRVRCALFVEVTAEEDLATLDWDALPQPVMVLGGGSNLLFTKDFPGTVLHVNCGLDQVQGNFGPGPISGAGPSPTGMDSTCLGATCAGPGPGGKIGPSPKMWWTRSNGSEMQVTVPAATIFDDFCAWAAEEGLWGPENLSLIPGECGASAVQNIGAYGVEVKDILADIRAWDRQEGRFVNIDPATCGYGYRKSNFKTVWKGRYVITAVTYRLCTTPQPKLDYGGLRKALEMAGQAGHDGRFAIDGRLVNDGHSSTGPSTGPSTGSGTDSGTGSGTDSGSAGHDGKTDSSCPAPTGHLTPRLIRDAIIGIRRQKLPEPEEIGSAGSFFCNPVVPKEVFDNVMAIAQKENGPDAKVPHFVQEDGIKIPAAWLIDQCGFKGAVNGGAQVWQNQPLVIVNASGSASPEDIIGLENRIIGTIAAKYGITLKPEVEHV